MLNSIKIFVQCIHPGCNKEFASSSNLKRHKLIHLNIKPFRCDFLNCNRSFNQKVNLQQHKKCHSIYRTKDYSCDLVNIFENPWNQVALKFKEINSFKFGDSTIHLTENAIELKCLCCYNKDKTVKFNNFIDLREHLFQHTPDLSSDLKAMTIAIFSIISMIFTWEFKSADEKV